MQLARSWPRSPGAVQSSEKPGRERKDRKSIQNSTFGDNRKEAYLGLLCNVLLGALRGKLRVHVGQHAQSVVEKGENGTVPVRLWIERHVSWESK